MKLSGIFAPETKLKIANNEEIKESGECTKRQV